MSITMGSRNLGLQKSKALPTVPISKAYEELSRSAFALLLFLMTADKELLGKGRPKMAAAAGYSLSRFNGVLRELNLKGYVRVNSKPGGPTNVGIVNRLIVQGPMFVRLGVM